MSESGPATSALDAGEIALVDQLRLDADNMRQAEDLQPATLRAIAHRIDWAATRIGGPRP